MNSDANLYRERQRANLVMMCDQRQNQRDHGRLDPYGAQSMVVQSGSEFAARRETTLCDSPTRVVEESEPS